MTNSMSLMELHTHAIAAGGGCVARADDGRVVFVRHSLPGERVLAHITGETTSFLRADAVEILEASPDRVTPPCPHAGPDRCGGCDFQHVAVAAQRALKASLVSEQLRRLAGDERPVVVEEVIGAADGLGWRTRVRFAVDRDGRVGLHKHRSHAVEPVEHCLIASGSVDAVGVGAHRWSGARELEVLTSPDGGKPVVSVETGRRRLGDRPPVNAGRVVNGRTEREPHRLGFDVLGRHYQVSAGSFGKSTRLRPVFLPGRFSTGWPHGRGRGSPTSMPGQGSSPHSWPARWVPTVQCWLSSGAGVRARMPLATPRISHR